MTADTLTLIQWLSPAFPLGSFAYSHGLETAITQGAVCDAASLTEWLSGILTAGAGQTDAVLLYHALQGTDVTDTAIALAPSRERLEETMAQGRAFARTVTAMQPELILPDAPLPVVVGVAAKGLNIDPAICISLYVQAFISNLITIAVRHVPLGQTQGQQVLHDLKDLILTIADQAIKTDLDQIGTASFASDLAAMTHETQDVRIFKT
ncbi:urease accessory protein UreF [Parasulfitobacter algicola]|uniref:Urease accessory protein UreF n=1 Tax=Parasulfitobacter algicola TaxID=2614809 RepID=A0ABX2IRV3_9RHOB|nr:urease accessory UreF family protein [Sulfitobacter algicola]NSX55621.1 urease accessory protein UreF [Sulfitobacter algicola]